MTGFRHKITSNYDIFRSIAWILNFALAVSAGGVIAIGAVKLLDVADFNDLVEAQIAPLQIAVIMIGSLQALLAFYGFLAIIKEVHYMLYAYLSVLYEVILMKYLLPLGWNLGGSMHYQFLNVWQHRNNIDNWKFIDLVQKQFECCGLDNAYDYIDEITLPASCCPPVYEDCNRANTHGNSCRAMIETWGMDIVHQIQLAIGLTSILDMVIFAYVLFIAIPVLRLKRKHQQMLEFKEKLKTPKIDY